MSDKAGPDKAAMADLGAEIAKVIGPLCTKYPGLEFVVSYALPRNGSRDLMATGVASNIDSPKRMDPFTAVKDDA